MKERLILKTTEIDFSSFFLRFSLLLPLSFSLLFCLSFESAFAQSTENSEIHYVYLPVEFERSYDAKSDTTFYFISVEAGCPSAKEIYSLIKYEGRKNKKNAHGEIFAAKTDSSSFFYNYFYTETEALNFLSSYGWELFLISNKTSSEDRKIFNADNHLEIIPKIYSDAKFYFRKKVNINIITGH